MAKSIQSEAEPKMLRWCRTSAGYSTAQAAEAIGREESEVVAWEAGEGGPTLAQLRKLAHFYRRPLAVFYLPENPRDFTLLQDFRRLPGGRNLDYSPALRFLIRSVQNRQAWLSEYLVGEGEDKIEWVGSATAKDNPLKVGVALRGLLGVTLTAQREQPDKDAAFRFWRERCESSGACVFLSRGIEIEEMRGFALANAHAPAALVNDRDAYAGRTFTLLHEMAHLMIGVDGVSDRNIATAPRSDDQRTEVFCNAVAAEALVPAVDFSARVPGFGGNLDAAVVELSNLYRVSEEVIARRLLDLDFAGRDFYEQKREELNSRVIMKRRESDVRIRRARLVLSTIGRRFARATVSAFQAGELSGADFVEFTDLKLNFLSELEAEIFPSRVQYFNKTGS